MRTFDEHLSNVTSVAYSSNGRHAMSGSADNTIKLWDMTTGNLLRTLESHKGQVLSV